MAEMNVPGKKGSPRVDLTAMVDLGFLLITFFMLVTTYSKPKTMEVNKPAKPENEEEEPAVKKSKTLSVLLGENDKVYWYVGADDADEIEFDSTDFSKTGIRQRIMIRQKEVERQWGNKDELIVLIKSMPGAKYKSFVNILDEMSITQTKRYAIVDIDPLDSLIMGKVGARFGPALDENSGTPPSGN
jgi:biopolymer transport protein ExbD